MDQARLNGIRKDLDTLSSVDVERERGRIYYRLHKDKIARAQKDNTRRKQEKVCSDLGFPVMLAPYIKFYNPKGGKKDRVALTFDSKVDLIEFLIEFKFSEDVSIEELNAIYKKYKQNLKEEDSE